MSLRLTISAGIVVLRLLLCCAGVQVLAQSYVPPTPMPATAGPGSPNQTEYVDPITGVVNLSFPLAKLPPGPGGFTMGVNLGYTSAFYQGNVSSGSNFTQIQYTNYSQSVSVGSTGFKGTATPGGWGYNFRYNLWSNYETAGFSGHSMYLTTPDGANHLLILTGALDVNGNPLPATLFQQNYTQKNASNQMVFMQPVYDVDLDGTCPSAKVTGYSNSYCSSGIFSGTFIFATADNTFIRVESNTATGAWTAYLPDGTQASGSFIVFANLLNSAIASEAGAITDRNGNKVTITNYCEDFYAGACATVIQDKQGRQIAINYGTDGATSLLDPNQTFAWSDTITQPGVNGRLQTIVNWAPGPALNTPRYDCSYTNGAIGQCDPLTETPFIVTSVQFPSPTNGGPSTGYLFFVVPPGGNTTTYNWGELHSMIRLSVPPSVSAASCMPPAGSTSTLPCSQVSQVNYTYLFDYSTNPNNQSVITRAMSTLVNPIFNKTLTYLEQRDGATNSTRQTETTAYVIPVPASFNAQGPPQISGTSTVTAPDGSVTSITLTNACSFNGGNAATNLSGFCPLLPTQIQSPDGTQSWISWTSNMNSDPATGTTMPGPSGSYVNPYPQNTAQVVGSMAKGTGAGQDVNGNTTSVAEYDWFAVTGSPANATQLLAEAAPYTRATDTTFNSANAPAYWNHAALTAGWTNFRVPQSSTVTGSATTAGGFTTTYTYDYPRTKANLTAQSWADSVTGATLSRTWNYLLPDGTVNGNLVSSTETSGPTLGIKTQIRYDGSDLYPQEVDVIPIAGRPGSTSQRTTNAIQFDFNSGLIVTATDADNSVKTVYTYDNIGRQIRSEQTGTHGGASLDRITSTGYDDVGLSMTITTDQMSKGDQQLSSTTYYDPLGRVRLTIDPAGNKAQKAYRAGAANGCVAPTPKPTNGISSSATILSCELESNPYSAVDGTMGWTVTLRTPANPPGQGQTASMPVLQKQTYAGPTPPAPWGSNSNLTGTTVIASNDVSAASCWPSGNGVGPTTDVTDQASHTTRYCHDALGRLAGLTDAANNNTLHAYDLQDHLTKVTQTTQVTNPTTSQVSQASQVRTFSYSLGRPTQACNPETSNGGSQCTTYAYDDSNSGNLLTKTDPLSRITCFGSLPQGGTTCTPGYDGFNRPTARSYSDSTPTVTYAYDQGGWVGALSSLSTTVNSTTYGTSYSYDALGRVSASAQTTQTPPAPSPTAYGFQYSYTLSDELIQIQYPQGEKVAYGLDGAGRVSSVQNTTTGAPKPYANAIAYTPSGGIAALSLANGVTEQLSWNDRFQLTQLNVGTGSPASLLTLGLYPCAGLATSCSNGNVGNILAQTIAIPGLSTTQNYSYDALNHLTSAGETVGSQSGAAWSQTYNYIPGSENRFVTGTPPPNLTVSPTTPTAASDYNGLNQLQRTGIGAPSAAGELPIIGPYTLQYDAEGRVTSSIWNTVGSNNSLVPTQATYYAYDGEGQRVMKLVCPGITQCTPATTGAVETLYVYDALGNLSQEYSTNPPTLPCATCFVTVDQVGSTRLVTDGNGNPVARYDYLPFGEEIPADGATRTEGMGYTANPDSFNPKFTGQMRDPESGFDYFNARYYDSRQGRFMIPDPGNAGSDPSDPTTWNGYAYVGNNPLSTTDPSGEGFFSWLIGILVNLVEAFISYVFPPAAPWLIGANTISLTACGGPLGNCGALPGSIWDEQSPVAPNVQNPGGFIFNQQAAQGWRAQLSTRINDLLAAFGPLPPPPPPLTFTGKSAPILFTRMNGGKPGGSTTFYPGWGCAPMTIETLSKTSASWERDHPGAGGPYCGLFVGVRRGGDTVEYGKNGAKIITTDDRYRWIHGGGTPLVKRGEDPLAPYQDLTETQGCTRGHNQDVIDLGKALVYWQHLTGMPITYCRK
jgi:RHS repeat-associated protein